MPEKAPTMASSSYDEEANNPTNLSGESWDPQIIAGGGTPSKVGPGGMIDVSPRSRSYREQQRRKTFGKRGQPSQHRHITSDAASGNDMTAQAAALSAAEGGPAAPSAQVGVEVTPSKSKTYADNAAYAKKDDDDDSLLRAATGSAEEAAAAERAMREHELRAQSNPVLACVDNASVMFREKVNCEYFEERQPTPRKQRPGALNTSVGSAGSAGSAGGRVVTVGGQTTTTQSRTLSPPSVQGGVASPVREIIEESAQMADRPSPHSARKSQAFFSQFDVSVVKSSSTDAGDEENGGAAAAAAAGTAGREYEDEDEDMPEDELNESRSRSRSNSAVGTARDGPSPSNTVPPPPAADGKVEQKVEEEEEDIITSITRTISEMCMSPGGAAAAGAGGAVGAAAVASSSGAKEGSGGGDGQEEADMPPNEAGLDVDICTYLQNICGVPTVGGDEPPPPPPPPPADGSSSPTRSPGSGVRAIAIGGAGAAGVGAAAAVAASRGNDDDEEGLSTSMNGKAAQLDLSATRGAGGGGTDQQENTAIEVEYVDPDYYSSDEDDDEDYEYNHRGAAAAVAAASKSKPKKDKKKKGGLGKGLSKMFGKSKSKKVGPHDDEEKKGDVDPAKIAATAAAAAAAAGTAAALAAQGDEAGTLTDEDDSQGTADHVGGADGADAEVVRAPEAGQEPFDETGKPSGSEGWTVDEKNAHLQAMASKARDDYMYGKGSPPPSPGRGAADADGTPDDSSVPEDDYAEWRPSEKRRFLQLLSQGMSPREAARDIKNARRGIEPGVSASPRAEAAEAAESPEEAQVDEAADESVVVDDKGDDDNDDEEPVEEDDDSSPVAAAAVAAGATAVTAAGVAAILNKTAEDEETPANILSETGVGYYDGVEREGDDAAAENIVDISALQSPKSPQDAASVKSNKRSILPVSLKSKGFSSLDSDMNAPDDRRKRGNIKALFAGGKNKTTRDGFATLDSDSENELEENFEGERSVAASKATGANDDDTIFDFNDDKTVEAGGVGAASTPRGPQPDTIPEDNAEPVPSSEMSVVSGVTMNTEYTDNMTVGTAYTNASTKSTRRRHRGAAKKRLNKAKEAEDGKSVGWLDSIRTAAANNNRVWDPQLGWVDYEEPEKGDDGSSANHIGPLHLPVKARDAQHGDDQMLDRDVDADDSGLHAIDEDGAAEVPTSRAAYGAAAVGATAATAAVVSNMANSRGQQDDGTVTSALTENTSRSAVTDRQGAPKGWVESMKAASERVSASDPNRRWDPQHGWIGLPPGTMPPTEDKEEDVQTQEATDAGPETPSAALNTSVISERSAGPVDLDDSDVDDDDDESVEEEKDEPQALPEEPPEEESVVSRRIRPDPSGVLEDSEDATLASGMLSADAAEPSSDSGAKKPFIKLPAPRMGRGRGAAQQGYDEIASVASENRPQSPETGDEDDVIVKSSSQTSYEQFQWEESNAAGAPVAAAAAVGAAAAVAASSLPPKVPKKDRPDSAEKSAPEVQVVKLKMNDKDKDLFLNSKDDSNHFIDDTNFAPEFADESPFSTPSRAAAAARGGIEADGDGIGLDTTQSDIVRSSPKSETVEDDAGIVSSKTSRDPPQNAAEAVDGASAAPSVSSRAKQWMELMESKSKKNVGAAAGTEDTKSEASSAIDWPGSGSSARKAQSKGGEEWKSFLGKKCSTGAPSQQPGQAGNALKFAAADGGSEADFKSDTGAPSTARGGLARAPTDDDDTIFKFDETSQMGGTNPLKAKLQNMNSARAMPGVSEASETTGSSDGEPSSTGGEAKGGKKSIFKRLTECAAPVLPEGCANPTVVDDTGKEVPVSHLEFLKKSKVAGSLREIAPSTLCGRPDTIYEEGPGGRRRATKKSASTSSVVSGDGFGAKNAYLDAVALKTATRGRSSSTGRPSSRGRSSSSQRSGTSQRSSESWQGFLERRSASKSPGPSRPPTSPPVANVSAEQKAAQKVEEMMKAMAMNTKSKADIDDMIETMSQSSSPSKAPTAIGYDQIEMTRSNISSFSQNKKKSESAIAAEELAAARVEAMMKAMSSQKLDGDV